MLKLPTSRGYVLLEALIGLMVLSVVSLISFTVGQLYRRQQLKGCFLDAASTQLMDLQASATYPTTIDKIPYYLYLSQDIRKNLYYFCKINIKLIAK